MSDYERFELVMDICLAKPRYRGKILESAFPFADIEVSWDEMFLRTDVFAYDTRKAIPIPFTFDCKHELILHETYEASDLTTQDGLFRIASAIVDGLDEYFNDEHITIGGVKYKIL